MISPRIFPWVRLALLGLLAMAVAGPPAVAAEPCGAAPVVASSEDGALIRFARRQGVSDPETFRNVAAILHRSGRLPSCYLTKSAAEERGWRAGADLWRTAPGGALGGDRFANREGALPAQWNRRYVEADLDYAGGHRGGHRLVFVRDMGEAWLIFVTTDHYRTFARFEPEARP